MVLVLQQVVRLSKEQEDGSDDEAEEGFRSPKEESEVKKDKRFFEQSVETGEESETTVFAQRAKLYQFVVEEKKWVERGTGTLKLNVKEGTSDENEDEDEEAVNPKVFDAPDEEQQTKKTKARFVMRAEGSQRVILNSPVQKGSKFGDLDGKEPKDKAILFLGRLEGSKGGEKLEMLQMKVCSRNICCLY